MRDTRWFIEPRDEFTNRVLCDEGALDTSEITVENGNIIKVWEVLNYDFITRLIQSSKTLPLKFKVYSKEGRNGKLRLSKLPFLRKKKSKKVRRIVKQLNAVQNKTHPVN